MQVVFSSPSHSPAAARASKREREGCAEGAGLGEGSGEETFPRQVVPEASSCTYAVSGGGRCAAVDARS